ncbi:MAG: acyl-CoA reductase [Chitinophagales bacterium]
MTTLEERIGYIAQLGERMDNDSLLAAMIEGGQRLNPWFVPAFMQSAWEAVRGSMLNDSALRLWLNAYSIPDQPRKLLRVGLVMAGNIPLVGFHDFLCVYLTGYKAQLKLSSKDDGLLLYLLDSLKKIDPGFSEQIQLVDKLTQFDAVIATGSDNTNRYFEHYFRNYPAILRRNRNSVAVLNGNETKEELEALADDIFLYFGLGCRNVSKLYVPKDYDVRVLFPYFERYQWLHHHTKYMNNYDYNRTILLMNKTQHYSNDFVMLEEKNAIASPIAVLYYETYENTEALTAALQVAAPQIQCVVASPGVLPEVPTVVFGTAQQPGLADYADGVDTIRFLISL